MMLKPKFRKGEIGTIVMMALLVIVSLISFSSSNFLSKKQTVNTKAATTTCKVNQTPVTKCGSGNNWECTTANGCDPSKCTTANLEFNCCVLNKNACSDGSDKYRWYGCTGQFCQNQTISQGSGDPGHLVACQSGVGPGKAESCQSQSSTPTPTPQSSIPAGCEPTINATECHDAHPGEGWVYHNDANGKYCCPPAATPTPTRTPTPTIVNTPLPTSSGKICAIFTLDYKCYGIGKIFHPSQIVSVCPKNSSCWGIDTSSCDQTFEEVQKYFCSDQPPTPTGPTVTPTRTPTPTKTPTPTSTPEPTPTVAADLSTCQKNIPCGNNPNIKYAVKCTSIGSNNICVSPLYFEDPNSCTGTSFTDIATWCATKTTQININYTINATGNISLAQDNICYIPATIPVKVTEPYIIISVLKNGASIGSSREINNRSSRFPLFDSISVSTETGGSFQIVVSYLTGISSQYCVPNYRATTSGAVSRTTETNVNLLVDLVNAE